MIVAKPGNEAERLKALRAYRVLDTAAESSYDDLTRLAALVCGTPIAIITLIDSDRQWFKSRVGTDVTETPREYAFCAHAILGREVLVVEDAAADARFADNPLVTGGPRIRFYAGAPLTDAEGHELGTLCVLARAPRRLTAEQIGALAALARQVVALLEYRRTAAALAGALEQVSTLTALLPLCAWCKAVRDDDGYWRRVDEYLCTHAVVTHGICPACYDQARGEMACAVPNAPPVTLTR